MGKDKINPVFQLEIRFSPILNFNHINKELVAPYVKFSKKLNVENENRLDERIVLVDDLLSIFISWDRLIFKGQNNLDALLLENSKLDHVFFGIFSKIKDLESFDSISSVLFISTYVLKSRQNTKNGNTIFLNNTVTDKVKSLLPNSTDSAVVIERKNLKDVESLNFGPYNGVQDLENRLIKPLDISVLGDMNYDGLICEYKKMYKPDDFDMQAMKDLFKISESVVKDLKNKLME